MDAESLSRYEALTLGVSVVALIISAAALLRGHRLALRQTELQAKQADLAAFQHKLLLREQDHLARADLRAQLVTSDRRNYKFVLTNAGPAVARNVRLSDPTGTTYPEPLFEDQCAQVFPIEELRPGESRSFLAVIHLGTKLPVGVIATWDDGRGADQQRELQVDIM